MAADAGTSGIMGRVMEVLKMKRILQWLRRGNGEIVGFAIVVPLLYIMICSMASLVQLSLSVNDLGKAAISAGRAVAISDSLDAARTIANEAAMVNITNSNITNVTTDVEMVDAPEWGAGVNVKVTVSADISTFLPFVNPGRQSRRSLVTVETGGFYLGQWMLTGYCPCRSCSGPFGSGTALGRTAVPGQTVAIARSTAARFGLHYGDKLMIRGHIYTYEDDGGPSMTTDFGGMGIDIYVATHPETYSDYCNGWAEVYKVG